jgi:hypothetical protein
VAYLDDLFPNDKYETSGYVVGKINGDHWCLYTANPIRTVLNQDGDEIPIGEDDEEELSENASECDDGHLVEGPAVYRTVCGDGRRVRMTSSPVSSPSVRAPPSFDCFPSSTTNFMNEQEDDVTLEIMMQDLDPEVTKLFWRTEEEQKEIREREALEKLHGKPDTSNVTHFARAKGLDGMQKTVRKAERRLLVCIYI